MKTALITGASRGIGRQTAQELAGRGYRVFLGTREQGVGGQSPSGVEGDACWLTIDVADSASIAEAEQWVTRTEERLDVLINNAGVSADGGVSIADIPRGELLETFHVNTFGPIEVAQAFLPLLRRSDDSRVINLSSGLGQLDRQVPDMPSYCLSKLALNGFTRMLAEQLRGEGIAVNAACPGWVRTDMGGAEAPKSVEEGAAGIVWLATEAPRSATGKFFRDGVEIPW